MIRLSASKIKTLLDCSWRFWTSYYLKLEDKGNPGSLRGSSVHDVLECLLRPDRKKYVETVNKTKSVSSVPALARFIKKKADFYRVGDEENLAMIEDYIVAAISADFYCSGALNVTAELMFEDKNDRFWVVGFLDKIAEYAEKVVLIDYKCQKQKFSAKDLEFSIQALMYLMVARAKFPDKELVFEFHQLRDRKSRDKKSPFPIQTVTASDDILDGFKEWLVHIGEYIKDFNEKKATLNFAKKDFTKSRMCCGGELGQLKKDLTPVHICAAKYPNMYFSLIQDNKIISSAFKKSDLEKIQKPGQVIEEKFYEGCPAWKFLWDKKS